MIRESSMPQAIESELPKVSEMAGHLLHYVQEKIVALQAIVQKLDSPWLQQTLEAGIEREAQEYEHLEALLVQISNSGRSDDETIHMIEDYKTDLQVRREFIRRLVERRDSLLEKQS